MIAEIKKHLTKQVKTDLLDAEGFAKEPTNDINCRYCYRDELNFTRYYVTHQIGEEVYAIKQKKGEKISFVKLSETDLEKMPHEELNHGMKKLYEKLIMNLPI